MSKRRSGAPILVTEFKEMSVKDGLFYVRMRAGAEEMCIVMSPCMAVRAIAMAGAALQTHNVVELDAKRA